MHPVGEGRSAVRPCSGIPSFPAEVPASAARDKLELAEKHLERVQGAWYGPDWADLSIYGLYCLEAAVEAAALLVGITTKKQHWAKSGAAAELHRNHGFADVEEMMRDLNEARKAEAYGDVVPPELDAEYVASEIEQYVERVRARLEELEADTEEE
jgi:hypothetical protein